MGTQRFVNYCCDWKGCTKYGNGSVPTDWVYVQMRHPDEKGSLYGTALLCPEHAVEMTKSVSLMTKKVTTGATS